ncbi:hypothetical protein FRC07_000644 [Ceratobasidium sp. 392]|nr:hypothetical protein FRC07_000644 [Ceratobasidium sp. 392]
MRLSRSISLGVASATVAAANPFALPPNFHRFASQSPNITWGDCESGNSTNRQCGRFEVPLDYQNSNAGKASLAVARYPATSQPKLGTLFLNPGGPGGSGVELILGRGAEVISLYSNGQYDLVSWDPRGVGQTHPRADCFATGAEEKAFWNGTIPEAGLEARGNFTDQADLDAFYAQASEVDRLLVELGQKCLQYSPDTFQYVGTAAAVRDMVALHDYLEGPDKPVDYWGFSYGTVIGSYFVGMFPDRVGRVIIDGVVDPVYWANRPPHEFWARTTESADEALDGFAQACALAGPNNCAIASQNSTAVSLRADIRNLIDLAYDYKKAIGPSAKYGSANLRDMLFNGMYAPTQWPELAKNLSTIHDFIVTNMSPSGNPGNSSTPDNSSRKRAINLPVSRRSPLVPLTRRQSPTNNSNPAPDYAFQAVTCADAIDAGNVTTQMVFDELVRVTRDVSPMFGPMWGVSSFYCHRWPVRAVERYTGPWNKQLSHPILVIGNEADPVTPFVSAKSVADALGDSAILIEQDDYGHASTAMHSDCTFAAIFAYFVNGMLPASDKFCGTNQQLFPGPGVTKSSLSASNLAASGTLGSSDLTSELDQAKARGDQLFIAVIALACAAGILLIGLVASCLFRRRQKKTVTHPVYFPRDAHEEQGHIYATPYDGVKGEKAGGYAPVQT